LQTFTTNDGVALSFSDSGGDGVPLVMLHGFQQTKEAFRHQVSGLADSRRIITLDFRGHGESDKPRRGYRISRFAMDVSGLLEHLQVPQVDALGWSMGASVWWSYIDLFGTGRLRRLVMVDQPSAITIHPWMTDREQIETGALWDVATVDTIVEAMQQPQDDEQLRAAIHGACTGEVAPELMQFMVGEMRKTPSYAATRLLYDHCAQDWRDVLARIDVPSLVIGCEGSHVSPASQRYLAELVPGARVHVFAPPVASSHFPFLQNPGAFNEVLAEFLG